MSSYQGICWNPRKMIKDDRLNGSLAIPTRNSDYAAQALMDPEPLTTHPFH